MGSTGLRRPWIRRRPPCAPLLPAREARGKERASSLAPDGGVDRGEAPQRRRLLRPGPFAGGTLRRSQRAGETVTRAAGPQRLLLRVMRRPAGQEDQLESGRDPPLGIAMPLGVEGGGSREQRAAGEAPGPG